MIKEILVSFSALALLTACGGSSSVSDAISSLSDTDTDTDKLSKKDGIVILYNAESEICESQSFLDEMRSVNNTKNHLIVVASNSVTCSTYGKNSTNCSTADVEGQGGQSCVVGFDLISSSKQLKASTIGEMEDIRNSMIITFD